MLTIVNSAFWDTQV